MYPPACPTAGVHRVAVLWAPLPHKGTRVSYLHLCPSSCEIHLITRWKVTSPSCHRRHIFMRRGREEPGLCSKNCAEQYSKSHSCLSVQMFLETPNQCIPDSGLLVPTRQALHEERIFALFNLIYSLATESSLYFPILGAYVRIPIQ